MPRFITTLAVALLLLPAAAAAKTVTEKSSGKTVHIAKGEKLVLKLTECAPCGYHWKTLRFPDPTILKKRSNVYVNPPGPAIGGAGKRVITYVGRHAGRTKITLGYYSPSGQKASGFVLKVVVG